MSRMRELVMVSRPLSWVNTGLPFLAGAFEVERSLTPLLILGLLYFLFPYNLLLYGVNDVFDYASDVRNPRKGSLEGGLVAPSAARSTLAAIIATNLPFVVLLAILGGPTLGGVLAIAVLVAIVYSAPPLRTKVRPVLDSATSAMHFVLPAVCGFVLAGRPLDALPWLILAAFTAWGMASHAIGAIQDIEADRAGGIGSIATALGARTTASFALIGYGLAVVLVGSLDPIGLVAALPLALYLLLPIIVLVGGDGPAAARRAWKGFLGLNFLAGFLLTQLLLRHWEVTTYAPYDLAVGLALGSSLLVLGSILATWRATRRRSAAAVDLPSVSIVVACRDEAATLPVLIPALRAQRHDGLEIIVVDDGSTDGSAAIASAALGDRGRVITAPPKPDGWAGKSWACQHGATEARGDLVFFVDADTVLGPDAARTFANEAVARGYDLVSGVTRYEMTTTAERALMPGFPLLLFGFVPVWLSAMTGGRPAALAFAYGPAMLVRRSTYLAVGGHGAAASSATEDLDLARTFARAHRRVGTIHAADLGATRHYRTAGEIVAAWRRIIVPYAGGSLAVAIVAVLGQALAFGLPLILPVIAGVTGRTSTPELATAAAPLVILVAARLLLAITQRQPLVSVLWHPVTVAVTLAAQVLGIADHVAGRRPTWRGRDLPLPRGPGQHAPTDSRPIGDPR
jgi:4-hydroxybenzoate polyprenyltransferase